MKQSFSSTRPSVAMTIAGADCSAGAGIQADLKAFQAHGVYGLTAMTGVVAENPLVVRSWQAVSAELLVEQLECLVGAYPIAAVKTGLFFNVAQVQAVAAVLAGAQLPLVIDPVGAASTGTEFGSADLHEAMREELFPLATLITPNLREAQQIAGQEICDQYELARIIAGRYGTAVLVKGGHSADPEIACDVLVTADGREEEFTLPRLAAPDFHGTGCTLSAAITANLANGGALSAAVKSAKAFLHGAIANGHQWGGVGALNLHS